MIKKYSDYINEGLGMAEPVSIYIDAVSQFTLNRVLYFHSLYADKDNKVVDRYYYKTFKKNDFNIIEKFWDKYPINTLTLKVVYEKRYDGDFMKDKITNKFVPFKVGGGCFGFAEFPNTRGKYDVSRINRDYGVETLDLSMEMSVDFWKTFDESMKSILLARIKSVVSHELNHSYEQWQRRKAKANDFAYGVTYATYMENDLKLPKSIWNTWSNKFLNLLYMSEPFEINAFNQEFHQNAKDCSSIEEFKTKFSVSWNHIRALVDFNSDSFIKNLSSKIKREGLDTEKTLDKLKEQLIAELAKNSEGEKKPRYSPHMLKQLTFNEMVYYFDSIFHEAGKKLIKGLGRAFSKNI